MKPITFDVVPQHAQAVREYMFHASNTQVYSLVALFSFGLAWRLDNITGYVLGIAAAIYTLYNAFMQLRSRRRVRELDPLVQIFQLHWNEVCAGKRPIEEAVAP